jgi:ATP-binding cassette subfamily F protein 3
LFLKREDNIPSRSRFKGTLTQFNGSILAVVHDRYFIERFASDVWTVKDGKVETW